MRNFALAGIAALLSSLLIVPSYAADESYAQLTQKTNKVESQLHNASTWNEAKINEKYLAGDAIRTGSESMAQFAFNDGSILKMSALSHVTIDPLKREIKFSLGKIFVKFFKGATGPKVITPKAVASALGTMWVQEILPNGATEIHVLEGQVSFTSGGVSQVVGAGQFVSALLDAAPSVPQAFNVSEYLQSEQILKGVDVPKLMQQTAPTGGGASGLTPTATVPTIPTIGVGGTTPAVGGGGTTTPSTLSDKGISPLKDNKLVVVSTKSNIPSGGLGWSFVAVGDGIKGTAYNPAQLGENAKFEVYAPQFSVAASNNAITVSQLSNLIMGGGAQSRTDIENAVAAKGTLTGKVETNLLTGFSLGNMGFVIKTSGVWDGANITPDAVALMLGDIQKLQPASIGTPKTWNIAGQITVNQPVSYGLTYAQPLNLFSFPLSVGATAKLYSGGAYSYNSFNVQGTYSGVGIPPTFTQNSLIQDTAYNSSGMGLDLGARAKLADNLYAGVSVTDIGGDITWNGTHGVGTASGTAAGTFTTNYTYTNATFRAPQNTTTKVGVGYVVDLFGPTMLAADYVAPKLTSSYLHAGAEKWIGPVTVRLGATGDINSSNYLLNYGIGFKLAFLNFDIAASGNGLNDTRGAFSFNLGLAF